jgi:hypothetical protein
MNQPLIDRINALKPCGAELRGILLALAGDAAEPAKPAAKYRDGTKWVFIDGSTAYSMRDGKLWYHDGTCWSNCHVDDVDADQRLRRIDVLAPAPTPAPADLEAASAAVCEAAIDWYESFRYPPNIVDEAKRIELCKSVEKLCKARGGAALRKDTPTPAPAKPPTMPPCVRELCEVVNATRFQWSGKDTDVSVFVDQANKELLRLKSCIAAVREYYGEANQ